MFCVCQILCAKVVGSTKGFLALSKNSRVLLT